MGDLFSEDTLRNPFPLYGLLRKVSPVLHVQPLNLWMIFDYEGVKRALVDHDTFSSNLSRAPGSGNPGQWFIFFDPPQHTKLRTLVSRAFTLRMVANLEPRIQQIARELLDEKIECGEMDLVTDFAIPLPMRVIAELLGFPTAEWQRYKRWSDVIMRLANTFLRDEEAFQTISEFSTVMTEMRPFVRELIVQRRKAPQDDLLTRLIEAELDGKRLSQEEIFGFMQLLLVAGQETTTNLITNAVLCLMENSEQLNRLHGVPELLPGAIEEVLRYRSPVQWVARVTRRRVEIHGQTIPAGKLMLAVIGSANHDEAQFLEADRFDITRDPNPHLAFGKGIHSCMGAALARLEARLALTEFLGRVHDFNPASEEPWQPRRALNLHGPSHFAIRFKPGGRLGRAA